jgi:hypothetical protein
MMEMSRQADSVSLILSLDGFAVMEMMMTIGSKSALGLTESCTRFQAGLMDEEGASTWVLMVIEVMVGMWVNHPGADTMLSTRNPPRRLGRPARRMSGEHSDVSGRKKDVQSRQGLTKTKGATQFSSCNQKRLSLLKPRTCSNKFQPHPMPLSLPPRWMRAPLLSLFLHLRIAQR